jgi:hypothetical protein
VKSGAVPFRDKVYTKIVPNIAGYKIHFVFSTNIQRSALKRWNANVSYVALAAALHHGTEDGHSWIILKENVGVAIMVHECWHAVYALLEWAGIPIDNNELVAYTIGWVVSSGQHFQQVNDARLKREEKLCRTKRSK